MSRASRSPISIRDTRVETALGKFTPSIVTHNGRPLEYKRSMGEPAIPDRTDRVAQVATTKPTRSERTPHTASAFRKP